MVLVPVLMLAYAFSWWSMEWCLKGVICVLLVFCLFWSFAFIRKWSLECQLARLESPLKSLSHELLSNHFCFRNQNSTKTNLEISRRSVMTDRRLKVLCSIHGMQPRHLIIMAAHAKLAWNIINDQVKSNQINLYHHGIYIRMYRCWNLCWPTNKVQCNDESTT